LLRSRFGSPAAVPLYCSADPDLHPVLGEPKLWDMSYLGTFSPDRQDTLERLLIEPATRRPDLRFVVAGPQYPSGIQWPSNVERIDHIPPRDHPKFYAASRFTLNVTRADMIRAGYSPSVRLFEAAACGTPIVSDIWNGIETLFVPGREIHLAQRSDDVLDALVTWPEEQRIATARAARERVLAGHTAAHRAESLEQQILAALGRREFARVGRKVGEQRL
jgi:spore maturation protein CgeB